MTVLTKGMHLPAAHIPDVFAQHVLPAFGSWRAAGKMPG
jgi:hypothetical protein